ncbi:MAG: bifunctional metallophosphatase/5'-nucleotidase [Myxococcota bacterium]
MSTLRVRGIAAALLLLLTGCAQPASHVVVLQTTDVEGRYSEPEVTVDGTPAGGLRRLAALVDRERDRRDTTVLLFDSGDMWSGTLVSDRNEGALGVSAYDLLGYDAVALGNHEFDYGPPGPARTDGRDPFGALRSRMAEAGFPFLAANVVDRETGRPPAWTNLHGSTVVDKGGLRVGVVGVITTDTPSITLPHVGRRLAFTDPAEAVTREARALRSEGADLVFVLAHIGAGGCQAFDDPSDLSSCGRGGHLFHLARDLSPSLVDGIFGGHSHEHVAHRVHGIPVLQAGQHGRRVSRLEIHMEASPGGTRVVLREPEPVTAAPTTRTARRVDELLRPWEAEVQAARAEDLGARLVRPLERNREHSSSLGSFLCDVALNVHPEAQVCLLNGGGLRADLPAGPVTYGQLYDVMPFGNVPALLEVSGATLLEILRVGTSGSHEVLQVGGLRVTYDRAKDVCPREDRDGDGDVDEADRQRLVRATLADGSPIDPDATYRIITNSFLATGGDDLRPILADVHPTRIRMLDDGLPLRDEIAAWMRRKRPILNSPDHPVRDEGRVVAVGSPPDVDCPVLGSDSSGR